MRFYPALLTRGTKLKAIDRIVEYIQNGKITFKESYYYQDIGA